MLYYCYLHSIFYNVEIYYDYSVILQLIKQFLIFLVHIYNIIYLIVYIYVYCISLFRLNDYSSCVWFHVVMCFAGCWNYIFVINKSLIVQKSIKLCPFMSLPPLLNRPTYNLHHHLLQLFQWNLQLCKFDICS